MNHQLYRIVTPLIIKPNFRIEDNVATSLRDLGSHLYYPNIKWDELAELYQLNAKERLWKEKILNLSNPKILFSEKSLINSPLDFDCNYVTSYDVLARRKDPINTFNDLFQLAAIGIVVTKDNYVLVGIRGGEINPSRVNQFASGLYGCLPGGSVSFREEYNPDPITQTLIEEFKEEVGNFEILENRLLGIFEAFRPGPIGYKFVSLLKTDATLIQIQNTNRYTNDLYQQLIGKGLPKEEISLSLKKKNLPPDAWEHSSIIGFPNDPHKIKRIIALNTDMFPGIGVGALMTYANHLISYDDR